MVCVLDQEFYFQVMTLGNYFLRATIALIQCFLHEYFIEKLMR